MDNLLVEAGCFSSSFCPAELEHVKGIMEIAPIWSDPLALNSANESVGIFWELTVFKIYGTWHVPYGIVSPIASDTGSNVMVKLGNPF